MRVLRLGIDAGWDKVTLASFRERARSSPEGTAYEAVRNVSNQRGVLIACTTHQPQIAALSRVLKLVVSPGPLPDWDATTLNDVYMCALKGDGSSFAFEAEADGTLTVVLFCAIDADSVALLEKLLAL